METAAERLILFTRYPAPGSTKTRLAPVLGPEGAAAFQRRLTERAAQSARQLQRRRQTAVEVRHAGGGRRRLREWLGPEFSYRPQGDGSIGARMCRSLMAAFAEGAARAVVFGSDIPSAGPAILEEAFDALLRCELVFGPAADGGYYLVGATAGSFRSGAACFDDGIDWGSGRVLVQSLARLQEARLSYTLLPTLSDVDRPEDLGAGIRSLRRTTGSPSATVVIPALNEAGEIAKTLSVITRDPETEVIVVDAGSSDATLAVARTFPVGVLASRPPRSVQMNAGAALAGGDVLIFLHADTRLPEGFRTKAREALARPRTAAGAFRLAIDGRAGGLRIIERAANLRSRVFQLPYGDQALFLKADLFWELGGFPPHEIMEDFELIRRLRRRGRIRLAAGEATTSARRWRRVGLTRTWLINQMIVAAYLAGIPPRRLAGWYHPKKG